MPRSIITSALLPGLLAGMVAWPLTEPLAWQWGARDQVVMRPKADWAKEGEMGVIPFTTLAAEISAIRAGLPCKWESQGGQDESQQYAFLCKGGTWAGISLILDAAPGDTEALGRVRLLWREWPEQARPGNDEAGVAREFVRFVASRVVPANLSERVQGAFMAERSKSWWAGKVLRITYDLEDNRTHKIHRLTVTGLAKQVAVPGNLLPAAQASGAPKATQVPVVVNQPVKPDVATQGLAKPDARPGDVPLLPVEVVPTSVVTPTVPVLNLPRTAPGVSQPVLNLPMPQGDAAAEGVVTPQDSGGLLTLPPLKLPDVLKPEATSPTLPVATQADFANQPDPEAVKTPVAPPVISTTLVPDAKDVMVGREQAPTNFDAYNKAEELTRRFEQDAMVKPNDGAKVVPAVQGASGLATDAAKGDQPGPTLAPVPTPSVDGTAQPSATQIPGVGTATGTVQRIRIGQASPTVPVSEGLAQPEDSRFNTDTRPLPQLKFIPKAQPLQAPDAVIKFEDEKSKL